MSTLLTTRRFGLRLAAAALLAWSSLHAGAAEIRVITSGAFTEAYKKLVPIFEAASGHTVVSAFGASSGQAPDSIPSRFGRGERFDLVILSENGLEALVKAGHAQAGTRVDLARSRIGAAVRKGTPKPDISTVEKLTAALNNAKSVAWSASASGIYLEQTLFPKLGVADRMKEKGKRILSERVGAVVARGDAEIGFQQVSELIYFTELDFLGPLPDEVNQSLFFSAAIGAGSTQADVARQLASFLSSAAVADLVRATGLDPVARPSAR